MSSVACAVWVAAGIAAWSGAAEPTRAPAVDLGEMVVTATRTETAVLDVPASVEVIGGAELRAANPINVEELFRTVPGVDLQGSGFPGSGIKLNLRALTTGFQSRRVLVLVDGRRVNDAFQGNVDFALLPADLIDRIEVVRGPGSALYGSNAMGGVINIITKKGAATPFTQIYAAGGEFNTVHARVSHGWKSGNLDYFVGGSHVETDGYANNSDGTDRDWMANNVAGNFGWRIGEDADLRLFLGAYSGEGTDENSDRTAKKDYQSLVYTRRWPEEGTRNRYAELQIRTYRNGQRDEYDWKRPGEGIYRQNSAGADVQYSRWAGGAHRVTAGVSGYRDAVDIDEVRGPVDQDTTVYGLFAQDEIHWGERFIVTPGLRHDDASDYDDEWSPKVGALCRVTESGELFGSVAQAHRAPPLSDRYVNTEYNGFLFQGNPDLEPEHLVAYELGYRSRVAEALELEVVGFVNELEDTFDFMLDPDGVFRNRNVTGARSFGVESSVRWRITDEITAFGNYTYSDGEYSEYPQEPQVEGNRIAYLARNKAAAGIQYAAASRWVHALECRYVGARYSDAQNTAANRLDDYVVVDWRSRAPLTDHAQLTVNLDNLFDTKYGDFPGLEQPGLFVLTGLEVTF